MPAVLGTDENNLRRMIPSDLVSGTMIGGVNTSFDGKRESVRDI